MSYLRILQSLPIVVLCLVWSACSGPDKNEGSRNPGNPPPPPFPTSFDALPPVAEPLPPDPNKTGLAYLQTVHSQIREPWTTFLEDCRLRLPPDHVLNRSALEVLVHLSIDSDGKLHGAALEKESGQAEFDEVALEIIREAAPFPKPPMDLTSDDDQVHIRWLLSRDRRQAGVATAEIYHFKWPPERSVPKFLAQNDATTAAHRLLGAIEADKRAPNADYLALGARIAEAVVIEGLASRDPATQLLAAQAVTDIRLMTAAEGLRIILDSSTDIEVRAQAIRAMGAIGDRGAAQVLLMTLSNAKGSGVGGKLDAGIAAALALAELGSADVAESTVHGWFQTADKESLWAALVVMSEFPVPAALPKLIRMTRDDSRSREVRMAACKAVGAGTNASTAKKNLKQLLRRFRDTDAAVRAACMKAVATIGRLKVRSRFTYWKVIELLKKDRDERVREAAVHAAVMLEPNLFHSELYMLRKEKSVSVLVALAEGLARVPDATAFNKLRALSQHQNILVRRAAVASLVEHADSRARAVAVGFATDSDMPIRLSGVRAIRDAETLTDLLSDDAPEVRRVAFDTLLRVVGKSVTLARMLRGVVENRPKSRVRIERAASWLTAK